MLKRLTIKKRLKRSIFERIKNLRIVGCISNTDVLKKEIFGYYVAGVFSENEYYYILGKLYEKYDDVISSYP